MARLTGLILTDGISINFIVCLKIAEPIDTVDVRLTLTLMKRRSFGSIALRLSKIFSSLRSRCTVPGKTALDGY